MYQSGGRSSRSRDVRPSVDAAKGSDRRAMCKEQGCNCGLIVWVSSLALLIFLWAFPAEQVSICSPKRAHGCQSIAMIPETLTLFCMGVGRKFSQHRAPHHCAFSRFPLGSHRKDRAWDKLVPAWSGFPVPYPCLFTEWY